LNPSLANEGFTLKQNEKHHILWALGKTEWKIRGPGGAAEVLDIHPSTLEFRIKKLGIQRPPNISRKRAQSNPQNNSLSFDRSNQYRTTERGK
jgi:hypothetical protein